MHMIPTRRIWNRRLPAMALWLFCLPRHAFAYTTSQSRAGIFGWGTNTLAQSRVSRIPLENGLQTLSCCVNMPSMIRPSGSALFASSSTSSSLGNATTSWDEEEHEDIKDDEYDETASPEIQEYEAWCQALEQALEKSHKKHKSLQSELTKAQNVETTVQRAQLLVSNLYLFPKGTTSAKVPDWDNEGIEVEVTLDPQYDSASVEAEALFDKARKLKRGSQILEPILEETTQSIQLLQDTQLDLESAKTSEGFVDEGHFLVVQERLTRSARKTGFQIPTLEHKQEDKRQSRCRSKKPELGTPASNIRKLTSPGGCTVLVGRNRRGNEYLSLTLARQDDVWMHSRGCPGAHVVIQNRRGGPTPTDACLQFAADLAIFYSDLRNEARAEVTAAEPKHLLKPRGAPLGAIKIREEWKTFIGRPDQVPDALKDDRIKSGQSDEYRQEDKAKHRRRSRQAAEEESAKRRKRKK